MYCGPVFSYLVTNRLSIPNRISRSSLPAVVYSVSNFKFINLCGTTDRMSEFMCSSFMTIKVS